MRFSSNTSAVLRLAIAVLACSWSGCEFRNAPQALATGSTLEVQLVSATNVANTRPAIYPNSGAPIYLLSPPVITSADIATIQRSEGTSPSLTVNLTPAGAKKLAAATTPATGQNLAVVANGEVIFVASVLSPLSNSFRIEGGPIQNDREQIFEGLTEK